MALGSLVRSLFAADVAASLVLLAGAVWSVAVPVSRIWPPPARGSWQYLLAWSLLWFVIAANAALFFLDWNSWVFGGRARFLLGVPIAVVGLLLFAWGVLTLGARNTAGLAERFVPEGPYRFTRNPQYLGDILLFLGLCIVANSWRLWVTHGLLSLTFLIAPWAEETWLEERYGEAYREYRRHTPRFL